MTVLNGRFPTFDFGDSGLCLILVRSLFVIALFASYGSILYRVRLAGVALGAMPGKSGVALQRQYHRLTIASLAATLVTACSWLIVQSRLLFASDTTPSLLRALYDTVASTDFGHVLLVQMALAGLALIAIVIGRQNRTALEISTGLGAVAVAFQVGHDHAASMYPGVSLLMLVVIAHLLAGAAWLGSLPALLVTIRHAPPSVAYASARRFSRFGSACVFVLAGTALFQGWQLIGSIPGLLGTAYGWMGIVKIGLFSILLGFAALNRYRLTPGLQSGDSHAKTRIVRSIVLELGFGIVVLVAASMLVTLPPAIHEQPVWLFREMLSLVTVNEDADFRNQVILSLLGLAGAVLLIAAAIYYRRLRGPFLGAAVVAAWFCIPALSLLFVEAYPTSFYHSTTGFSSISIAQGADIYAQNCVSCHGVSGKGDGPAAAGLPVPPADLTAPHLWGHSDGELFWWLTAGIASPEGEQAMPAFGAVLTEDERWNVIDFIRGRNAGLTYAATGTWSPNIQAPAFQAQCKTGTMTSADLKGRVIRLVFGDTMPVPPASALADRLVTVLVTAATPPIGDGQCLAQDPSVAFAYATLSGIPADKLSGTEFLIDPNGWLRAVQKPGQTISWNDPGALEERVVQLCTHPLAPSAASHAHHHTGNAQ